MSDPQQPPVVARLRAAGCVFAEAEAQLILAAAADADGVATMVERRVAGHPLEHILGWAEFCGRRIAVDPGVFVPRRRTELLVREAAARAGPGTVVVDLCCGSGAVGAVLATWVPGARVFAADVDPAAVDCARRNLAPTGGRVFEGDLFDALPAALSGRVDILAVNAPYVPSGEIAMMPSEARDHEPRIALDGGADGLDIQRRVAAAASRWLVPGGYLLIETSRLQAPQTVAACEEHGLATGVARSADLDATVVIGRSGQVRADPTPAGPRHRLPAAVRW